MAINFPSSPTDGQQYTNPSSGIVYSYNTASSSWLVSSNNALGYTGSAGPAGSIGYTGSIGAGYTGSQGSVVNATSQSFTANGTQNTFILSNAITNGNNALVTVNGLLMTPISDYYVSGSTLYMTFIPLANAEVEVRSLEGGAGGGAATGAVGGGSDKVFFENDGTITTDYIITTGRNAMSAGPITINSNVVVTVPNNSVWVIV